MFLFLLIECMYIDTHTHGKIIPFLDVEGVITGFTVPREDKGMVLFRNVAIATIFLLWLHNFVGSFHDKSFTVQHLVVAIGLKLKTLLSIKGHSRPHLQVPSVCR